MYKCSVHLAFWQLHSDFRDIHNGFYVMKLAMAQSYHGMKILIQKTSCFPPTLWQYLTDNDNQHGTEPVSVVKEKKSRVWQNRVLFKKIMQLII